MPKFEAKKSDLALPFKFSAGGIKATAIFIGRASELTASEAYSWVKSSDKGTENASLFAEGIWSLSQPTAATVLSGKCPI
jgi:hypothetical protein